MVDYLASYVAQGLRNGERCFCAQKATSIEQLKARLVFLGIDVVEELRRGSLQIHTERDAYFPDGKFNTASMMRLLKDAIVAAKDDGFAGLRTAGEMGWAQSGYCDCDQLIEYERQVNETFPGQPAIGLCQYDVRLFPSDVLGHVLQQHCSALTQSRAQQSTFTIRNREYLADIIVDSLSANSQFFYVVQPRSSKEVVGWGAETSFDNAVMQADSLLGELGARSNRRAFKSRLST